MFHFQFYCFAKKIREKNFFSFHSSNENPFFFFSSNPDLLLCCFFLFEKPIFSKNSLSFLFSQGFVREGETFVLRFQLFFSTVIYHRFQSIILVSFLMVCCVRILGSFSIPDCLSPHWKLPFLMQMTLNCFNASALSRVRLEGWNCWALEQRKNVIKV